MAISVGVANPVGNLTVGNNYGTQTGYSPQQTFSPQQTISGIKLQNTYNPQPAATLTQPQLNGSRLTNLQAAAAAPVTQYDNSGIYKLLADSQAQTNALLAKYLSQPKAANVDYASINAQARKAAEGAVNPYYTKVLNQFLAQQAAQRQQTEAQTKTNIQNIEDQLKQTLEANQIAGNRTTEDTANNLGQINQTADEFQTDSGQQFNADRLALARVSSGGGLGAQQQEQAQLNRNTQEKRQETKFQTARDEQELLKARTFEDLARSGKLATSNRDKGVKQQQVDLANFIQNQGFETENKRNELERSRQSDILQNQSQQARQLFEKFISTLSDPGVQQATRQAYGGAF